MNAELELETSNINKLTYRHTYFYLSLMAKNMFEWIGLPDSVNVRFLEKVLFENGKIVFFKDKTLGYIVCRCSQQSVLNFYEEPIKVMTTATGSQFVNRYVDLKDEGVLIRNNASEEPTKYAVQLYANRISDTQRTIDTNISDQKFPIIVICDEKQKLTLANLYKKKQNNVPIIFTNKNLAETLEKTSVLKTTAPYVADKLMKYKHDLTSEFYTFIGINNVNTDKKERLITDEANSNNEQIEMSALVMLEERRKACDLINKMFPDLNVSVRLRDVTSERSGEDDINDEEGEDNE